MSTIDQFESAFRSAVKPTYEPREFKMSNILVITDLDLNEAQQFTTQLQKYLGGLSQSPTLTLTPYDQSKDLSTLLSYLNQYQPDLIVSHRHLHTQQDENIYTLGDHIEALSQITNHPILLFPHHKSWIDQDFESPNHIMVLTDQLTQHPALIDVGLSILESSSRLSLAHIEDELIFDRYINFIAKIPEIDTERAEHLIKDQMYKEAQDFFSVIDQALHNHGINIELQTIFKMGHRLQTYVSIVSENDVDLVVMQGKDNDQIAMHGLSYPLAVELTHLPLLIV